MKAANLERSERLQRVQALLSDEQEHSTMDIVINANVCAVNSIVCELRQNNQHITCQRRGDVWYYRKHNKPLHIQQRRGSINK